MSKEKLLFLNLDNLYEEPFCYTDYDIGDMGHGILIKKSDKTKFLNQFAKYWKDIAKENLEEWIKEDNKIEEEED